jgi:hypothetical protein
MTIESSVRNKVIEMHLKGKKRDEIAYSLNTSGIKISTGSISNVISKWREREQPDLNESRVTTFPEVTLAEKEFKKNPDISIENHTIVNTQDFEENGYPVGQGQTVSQGPLNWFTNGYVKEPETFQTEEVPHPPRSIQLELIIMIIILIRLLRKMSNRNRSNWFQM